MKLSVQTGGIIDRFGIEEGFRMIAEAGFDGVDANLDHCLSSGDIRSGKVHGFYDMSDDEIREAITPYKNAAERNGVGFIQAHAPFPNKTGDKETDDYVLEAVKKTIMMCGYIGCKNLVVHPGFLGETEKMTPEEEWDYNIAMYSALIPSLKKYDVICCLENMWSSYRGKCMRAICADPNEANRYINALNDIAGERRFGFCLDTGHANLVSYNLYDFIKILGNNLQVMHVHDNDGRGDQHLFPYAGIIDWDKFCLGLKEIDYSHDLSFETFRGMETFDKELGSDLLHLLHSTGEMFRRRIGK